MKLQMLLVICMAFTITQLFGQDLDPRAYIRLPVKTTTMVTGVVYSYGDVVTDPSVPIKDIKADVEASSVGVAHSFSLFGLSAQALAALPWTWAQVSGEVAEQDERITRSGLGDMRMRLSVLFLGAPAVTLSELMKAPSRNTILGASLNIVAPTGQFFSDKLINLGTNRWSFRPELAISKPVGRRWMLDIYTGLWLFTNNASFYPGTSMRKQDPMGTFQGHFSYNINTQMWVAFDATFYYGGSSSVEGVYNDDRQSNTRVGFTAVIPTGMASSLKFSASKGAIVRIGQNFTTISIGWQHSWIAGFKPSKVKKPQ